jgi:Flp pilus assembly protein TadD
MAPALRPQHVEACNNLGLLPKEMNRLAEAETACRRAIALRPDLAKAHINLGNVLSGGGKSNSRSTATGSRSR